MGQHRDRMRTGMNIKEWQESARSGACLRLGPATPQPVTDGEYEGVSLGGGVVDPNTGEIVTSTDIQS